MRLNGLAVVLFDKWELVRLVKESDAHKLDEIEYGIFTGVFLYICYLEI